MDNQIQTINQPNYKKIYEDIIAYKYSHKMDKCKSILKKDNFSEFDIIELNNIIFGQSNSSRNQLQKSYTTATFRRILDYQEKNKLNNSELAIHFKISRNTITKWKRALNK